MITEFEDATPNPEFLIKSIAEQGYSLETSLADLMDNSISAGANKIEVLTDTDSETFKMFLADNGKGMTEKELSENMKFPSNSPENDRNSNDLGRFGLGMKTASFSQTRKFTVLSRKINTTQYYGRTWDVNILKNNGWKIIVNNEIEIDNILNEYRVLSNEYGNPFEDLNPNTIILWHGLFKFENYLSEKNKKTALIKEINEITSDYLSLVFHRFMEKKEDPLKIRINNTKVEPINPFPEHSDIRQIEPKQAPFGDDVITIVGYVLPSRSIDESKNGISEWTTRYRGLMDMEGIYIYRANRLILFGTWNGLIKKSPRLQLGRLKVDIGNSVDHLFHLNVAKSQIQVPHELREAFEYSINELKEEAEREFFNRGIRKFSGDKNQKKEQLFEKSNSNKGSVLELNFDFPLIKTLFNDLDESQQLKMRLLFRMINNRVNSIRQVHEEKEFLGVEEKDGISEEELFENIKTLLEMKLSVDYIKEDYLSNLGFKFESFPSEFRDLLKNVK